MFVESNPVPAKYSLNLMGMMSEEVRLPLVTAEKISKEKIKAVLNIKNGHGINGGAFEQRR